MANDKKTWVRFKASGVPHGYAHFAGDICELPEKDTDRLMAQLGVAVPAKAEEIEAAKAAIEAEAAAKPTAAPPLNWKEQFDAMQAQITALAAAAAKK